MAPFLLRNSHMVPVSIRGINSFLQCEEMNDNMIAYKPENVGE